MALSESMPMRDSRRAHRTEGDAGESLRIPGTSPGTSHILGLFSEAARCVLTASRPDAPTPSSVRLGI